MADPGIARGGLIFVGEAPKGYGMERGTPTITIEGLNARVLSTKIVIVNEVLIEARDRDVPSFLRD